MVPDQVNEISAKSTSILQSYLPLYRGEAYSYFSILFVCGVSDPTIGGRPSVQI